MTVTVRELMAVLATLPPETEVYVAYSEIVGYSTHTGYEPLQFGYGEQYMWEGMSIIEAAESENFEYLAPLHSSPVPWIRFGRE